MKFQSTHHTPTDFRCVRFGRALTVLMALLPALTGSVPVAAAGSEAKPEERSATSSANATRLSNGAQYELIGRYDVARLNQVLTNELAAFTDFPMTYPPARYPVKLYRVTYPSVIPEKGNRPTTATGLVAIPETGKKEMPMVSYQHGTVYGKQEVPSFPDESMETRLMLAQFAGQGYVVIGADYFGMGLSTEKDGYIVKASQAQAALDMYFAALATLQQEQIKVTDWFISGWSQGGFVTMAFLEKLEQVGVPVRAASTASAPADALVVFSALLNFPRAIDGKWDPIVAILSAFSFEEYYGVPGLAWGVFNPDQYENARKIYLKQGSSKNVQIPDFHTLIRPEYFDPQYFAASAYGRLLKETTAYRWVIKTPVRNYYGEVDEVVTVGLGRLPMNFQQSIGNNQVEAISAGPKATHRGTFVYAVAEQKKWFDALLTAEGKSK